MKQNPWFCFLCAPFTRESHGLLQPRADWAFKVCTYISRRSSISCVWIPFVRQLRSFLHQDLYAQLNRHLFSKGQPPFRVVVLHDNLGAVNYALGSLRIHLDQYMASERWDDIYELNSTNFVPLKNANQMKDEDWGKLCPIHLLVSCLPEKRFDPSRHQPAGREVGRRQFAEGGKFFIHIFLVRKTWFYFKTYG